MKERSPGVEETILVVEVRCYNLRPKAVDGRLDFTSLLLPSLICVLASSGHELRWTPAQPLEHVKILQEEFGRKLYIHFTGLPSRLYILDDETEDCDDDPINGT